MLRLWLRIEDKRAYAHQCGFTYAIREIENVELLDNKPESFQPLKASQTFQYFEKECRFIWKKTHFWPKSHFKFDKSIFGQKVVSAEQPLLPKSHFWPKSYCTVMCLKQFRLVRIYWQKNYFLQFATWILNILILLQCKSYISLICHRTNN